MCSALTAICKLISPDLINAVLPRTLELLTHPKELVRKKAVMALDRYLQLDPERDGPLAGVDLDRHLRQALCDKASACAIVIRLDLVMTGFCMHVSQQSKCATYLHDLIVNVMLSAGSICHERCSLCAARGHSKGPKALQESHPQLCQHP